LEGADYVQYKTTEVSFFPPYLAITKSWASPPTSPFSCMKIFATYASSNQKGHAFFLVGKSKKLTMLLLLLAVVVEKNPAVLC